MIESKFKKTELGCIPVSWNINFIEELIFSMNDGPFGTKLKQEHYTSKREARIIQLGNIGEDGWVDSNVKYTTFEYAKQISNHIVNPGDVVIAKMMPAGRAILCPSHEACFVQGSDAIKARLKEDIVPKYFIYGTKSKEYLKLIEENTQGSTRQRIAITKYRTLPFIVPPHKEQENIAEALSDVDALLKEMEVLIDKKRSVMQGTMQELLTARRRLPDFTEPWHEVSFMDLGYTYTGLSGKTGADFGHGNSKFIMFVNVIYKDTISPKYFGAVDISFSENQNEVHKNDLILNTSSETPDEVGMCSCVTKEYPNLYLNSFCFGFRFYESNVNPRFITFILRSKVGRLLMMELAQGSTRYNLPKRRFLSSSIKIPKDKREQDEIASILSDMTTEIEELEAKRDKYVAIRQGMIQQLLTGKIRLI